MKILSRTLPVLPPARSALFMASLFVGGCSTYPNWIASSGPSAQIINEMNEGENPAGIEIVDLSAEVNYRLQANQNHDQFAATFTDGNMAGYTVGPGDTLEVNLWEAPPAMLFDSSASELSQGVSTSKATSFPAQMVAKDGTISIPFAGQVRVAGKTPTEIQQEIVNRLSKLANQPQVLVKVAQNQTANVTVVGEVTNNIRMPLTARGERLLDALAAAGGAKQPVEKTTIQITRNEQVRSMPLNAVIRDPRQNIQLAAGDVVTAYHKPLSFTILGAAGSGDSGKEANVDFEASGVSLAQALGQAGGVDSMHADANGVFLFRFESADALDWPQPPRLTQDGKVPVVYRINLKNPASFLLAQNFPMQDHDLIYIAYAPSAELQKFMTLILTGAYPVLMGIGYGSRL